MKIYKHDKLLTVENINFTEAFKVIGGYKKQSRIIFIVECQKCKLDTELYLDGLFEVESRQYNMGVIGCGCSLRPQWEEWQNVIHMERRAKLFNCKFEGWGSEYRGSLTRTKIHCNKHNITWDAACLNDIRRYDIICPECYADKIGNLIRKPDPVMISNFKGFPDQTLFTRSDKKSKNGFKEYWNVSCPICEVTYVSNYKNLSLGCMGCDCSNFRQRQLYINIVYSDDKPIAVKFGIANDYTMRLKYLNSKNHVVLENYAVWEFASKFDCMEAEKSIKNQFYTGVVDRQLMPDGHTETASLLDFEDICEFLDKKTRRKPQQPLDGAFLLP